MKRLIPPILFFTVLCACSSPSTQTHSDDTEFFATNDTSSEAPIFPDDGSLDSLLRSRGYVYGPDIIESARSGNADARLILAQMYTHAICGAPANARKAYALYLGLADENIATAQAMAGYMTFLGLGCNDDPDEGLRLLALSVNQDCGLGYFFMGNIYAHNMPSTPENLQSARVCYLKASSYGIAAASQMLSQLNNGTESK